MRRIRLRFAAEVTTTDAPNRASKLAAVDAPAVGFCLGVAAFNGQFLALSRPMFSTM